MEGSASIVIVIVIVRVECLQLLSPIEFLDVVFS
jgi:hypothetical protein